MRRAPATGSNVGPVGVSAETMIGAREPGRRSQQMGDLPTRGNAAPRAVVPGNGDVGQTQRLWPYRRRPSSDGSAREATDTRHLTEYTSSAARTSMGHDRLFSRSGAGVLVIAHGEEKESARRRARTKRRQEGGLEGRQGALGRCIPRGASGARAPRRSDSVGARESAAIKESPLG